MEKATAQERVGQFLLIVRGDNHDRPRTGLDRLLGFIDVELHAVEFAQEIVGD